jgi:L-threonylcarbamoyladenylate synthase
VDTDALEHAASALRAGDVVALPTDTVYGLAAFPFAPGATQLLFELKGRPTSLELPVLVASLEAAESLVQGAMPEAARRVAERYWPGAVTMVVSRRRDLHWDLGGDPSTIGLRCPAHPVARWLCEEVGPLATTSANLHGKQVLATAREVAAEFQGRVALVLDGGALRGPPSTVVDLTTEPVRCLREGVLAFAEIEAAADAAR